MANTHVQGTLQYLQRENIRLKEDIEQLRQEVVQLRLKLRALQSLQQVSMQIRPNTNVIKLLERVLQSALLSIGASDGSLMLVDEDSAELVFAVVHGQVSETLVGHRIPIGTGIAGWVAQHRESVVVPDVRRDPRFSPSVDRTFQFHTRSMICVPITQKERTLGIFQAINKFERGPFDESDLAILSVAAQLAATSIIRAEDAVAADERG